MGAILSAFFIWVVNWFPVEASEQAGNEYPLFIAITYVSFVIMGIVVTAMAYSIWKFRRAGPVRHARRLAHARPHGARARLDGHPGRDRRLLRRLGREGAGRQRGRRQGQPRDQRDRLQLRLRLPLRQRRGLHPQRRALRPDRRDDHDAHDHAALHPGDAEERGHPQLVGAGVGGQAGRHAGSERQARRHDLGHAQPPRHLRGAVHRAVRVRARRHALPERARADRRRPSRSG